MSAPILRAESISRVLPGEVPVTLVDNISLEISRGEFVAITGPSGSGKSSLLYLLGLLDVPTAGRVLLNGIDTSRFNEDQLADTRLRTLGFVFQFHFLLPEFSALENVSLPIQRLGALSRGEITSRAEKLLHQLGIGDHARKLPSQLSGGQRQRVAIARALANDPAVILADEPTGNLDTASTELVLHALRGLADKEQRTIIMVTHDKALAQQADRIVTVVDGALQ